MSDNWVVQNLQNALDTWNSKLAEIWQIITQSPENFKGGENVPAPEADDYRDVRAAVDKLPEKLRTVVILFYFEELDVAATAAALSIPPGTVKSRLHKARTILKEVLAHEADLPF